MEKNNKLIAEFMGMTYYIPNDDSLMVEKAPIGVLVTPTKSLKYHESWDWLMPVIDKCYQEHMSKHIADAVMTCNIDKAYQVVVEFIKEYNDGKEYPFNEGDDYYTIEDGEVIWSCWDDVSEELHNDNPDKQYFKTKKEAENYIQNN